MIVSRRARKARLALAISLSVVAHGLTGVCTYTLLSEPPGKLIPIFPLGDPSVSLTIETGNDENPGPVEVPPPEIPAPPEIPPPAAEVLPEPPPPPPPAAAEVVDAPVPRDAVVVPMSAFDSPVDSPDAALLVAAVREPPPEATRAATAGPVGQGGGREGEGPGARASGQPGGSPSVRLDTIRRHYPLGARMRGEEGVVTMKVVVDARGRPSQVEVSKSSGFPALDRAAVEAVKDARFMTEGGAQATGGETAVSIRYKLVN
jgi:periplasmic protein TonB